MERINPVTGASAGEDVLVDPSGEVYPERLKITRVGPAFNEARTALVNDFSQPLWNGTLGCDDRAHPKGERAPLKHLFACIRQVPPGRFERLLPHSAM